MTPATKPATSDIPTRDQIEQQYKWNLADLYESDKAWENEFLALESKLSEAEQYVGKLTASAELLWNCLELRSDVSQRVSRLYQYAHLSRDLDNRQSKYQQMSDRAAALSSRIATAFSFIEPELLKQDEDKLNKLASQLPKTDVYDLYFRDLIRQRPHVRSEEVEQLLAMSITVSRGPDSIFTMLDDADLKYPTIKNTDGNDLQLTKQRFAKCMESSDARVRRDASNAFYSVYKEHANTLSATLSSSVHKDTFYSRARHHESALESSLFSDNIPVDVYRNLINATEEHIAGLNKYTELRKKLLKLDEIHPYDMICPLFPDADYEVPYDDAVQQVLESTAPLGSEYQELLRQAFEKRWVDVFETEGKGSGAYSYGTYTCHPFILMNYNDTVDNMFTLAHEMGHAMHSTLANAAQPFQKARYSLFVAEVASILNEALLLNYLVERADDDRKKLYLLNRQLDNTMGTFFHQVMYAHFELMIHEEIEKGGALSAELMNQWWADLTKKYYGPALSMDELSSHKWSRIPHFYMTFYVFQYATSYAASQAIFDKFMDGESGIIDRYLNLLKAGGSDYPIELLKNCGVDMTKPDAVKATIDRFAEQVDEVERLAGV